MSQKSIHFLILMLWAYELKQHYKIDLYLQFKSNRSKMFAIDTSVFALAQDLLSRAKNTVIW